jgi:hypothetical protein
MEISLENTQVKLYIQIGEIKQVKITLIKKNQMMISIIIFLDFIE